MYLTSVLRPTAGDDGAVGLAERERHGRGRRPPPLWGAPPPICSARQLHPVPRHAKYGAGEARHAVRPSSQPNPPITGV
eukprot:21140-Pyramimonas_sp.AAC.2